MSVDNNLSSSSGTAEQLYNDILCIYHFTAILTDRCKKVRFSACHNSLLRVLQFFSYRANACLHVPMIAFITSQFSFTRIFQISSRFKKTAGLMNIM